ncbi:protocadherin-16 isoform X2 [Vespa crabro]|uniref:protocadherin-16 isoform X2 n=1 Tax=Vespa crabro TaxID=7445 RepID=UPI001EFF7591|nr:protocadherin-16 isoform X2 [Vespa crabro]
MGTSLQKIVPLLSCMLQFIAGQLIRDTRCFLENGATAAHLFVNEDHAVGDIVGVLGVLGDPGPHGDIKLRLQELDSPVEFSPYSKNLTLTRPLDKEGVDGPASVYVNVICERKRTLDPGFVIPVNIRVTDANDNAPQFVNAPYVLNISEVTVVGTRVLQGVRAVDADQPGPYSTVQYAVLPGPHSEYFVFVNALEGTLVLRKPLDYEALTNFSIDIRAQDQGNPPRSSTTTLYVNVIDADDQNPSFLNDQYKVKLPSQIKTRTVLKVEPASIKAVDQDVGINAPVRYTIQGGILPFLLLNPDTAEIVIIRSLQENELLSPATIVVKATQIDNPDRYALATIVVSREDAYGTGPTAGGRVPTKFTLKDYQIKIPENTPPGSVILTMSVNRADSLLRFWLVGAVEDLERFSVTPSGELILKGTLDYEKRTQHSFLVQVTDGYFNDTSRVNVSIEDVNEWEPRFRHPRYEFHARSLKEGSIVGRLEAADGDRDDMIRLSLRGPDARSFEIHDNGELILRSMNTINGSMARLVAVVSDSGRPPRSSMVPVIVHIPNGASLPVAARAAPAWLGSSVLLVAVFGAVLGLLGVVILILILYIYKHKGSKSGGSVSSVGTGYREKSPVPSALSPTPQVLGASALQDTSENSYRKRSTTNESGSNVNETVTDLDAPGFGELNERAYAATIKSMFPSRVIHDGTMRSSHRFERRFVRASSSVASARQLPLYARHKIAPAPNPPALSATSNIPNIGGLVQNMNDLSARSNLDATSHDSSTCSGDPPDSLMTVWPVGSMSPRVKKLSWDDDDRTVESIDVRAETRPGSTKTETERLNLTVYF